jgi:hypothetical protein
MKLHLVLLVGVASLYTVTAHAQVPLAVSDCQPLTRMNQFECCNAPNWREIILPGSQGICDRDQFNREADDAVGSITPADDDDNVTNPPDGNGPPTQSGLGNPGNNKDVGNAGEKNMANEGVAAGDSAYGTKGNSNGAAVGNPSGVD